jgi:membrane-anchored protein YejM (alkaline phosphatase superfamily)
MSSNPLRSKFGFLLERLRAARALRPWYLWVLLFNLFFAQAISTLYFYRTNTYPESLWAWVFLFFYWCGHLFSLVVVLGLLWWLVLLLVVPAKWQKNLTAVFCGFLILLLIVDTVVYAQYRFHINLLVLDLFLNGRGQVISFSWQNWLVIFLLAGLALGLELLLARRADRMVQHQNALIFRRRILSFYLSAFLLSHLTYVVADAVFYSPITRLGWVLPFAAPAQAQSFLAKHGLVNVEEFKKRNALKVASGEQHFNYPLRAVKCSAPVPKMNVLWIVVDSLRADVLNREVMPNASSLAERSQQFLNHYSGSNTTRYGVFNMFYGLPGVYFEAARLARVSPLLIDQFQKANYEMSIWGSAPLNKPEFDQTVFSKISPLRLYSVAQDDYQRDQEITAGFSNFLDERNGDNPFFGFLFYDSCHGYGVDPKFPKKFQPTATSMNYIELGEGFDPAPVFNLYKNSANFVDDLIGNVLKKLAERNLSESTVIVVSSDHGQEFNDNHLNYWGHNSNFSDAQTHVPLLIYWPGRSPKIYRHRTVHYDLAPTFLSELFGCQDDPRFFSSGHNLFDQTGHKWVLMGRRDDFAIYRDQDIVVVKTNGDYEVVDHSYHPVSSKALDGASLLPALDELRRFF